MTVREEIIKLLDSEPVTTLQMYEFQKLKCSLVFKSSSMIENNKYEEMLDTWFKGVIESLFYKPNHCLLVFESDGGYSKDCDRFFAYLFPPFSSNVCPYSVCTESRFLKLVWYNSIIIQNNFEYQKQQKIVEEDNFKIIPEKAENLIYPGTDKRLASYCTTTEKWRYPQRKNVFVLPVESIDWELYNQVDKLKMWQELFNKFRTDI